MIVRVIKDFSYSADGLSLTHAVAGSEADIPDDLLSGLAQEGFISLLRETEMPQSRRKGRG